MPKFDLTAIPSQKGRIAIVTGANTGLGFEITLGLAKKHMKVIMACKNVGRAEKAKIKLQEQVDGESDLEIMLVDLSKLSSVKEFAKNYLAKHNRLDLLVNNAGIMVPPYNRTEDGFESQMGINYLSHFLMTGLLIDVIINTQGSRIVTMSSNAHKKGNINFDDLFWQKGYSPMGAYRQSKLACLMFAYELQRRLHRKGFDTMSLAAHPGLSITTLIRQIPVWLLHITKPFTAMISHPPAKGALPVLYASLAHDVNGGDYYGPDGKNEWKGEPRKVESTHLSHDLKVAERLWSISEELTGFRYVILD